MRTRKRLRARSVRLDNRNRLFFCRKYVVPLSSDPVAHSLSPFALCATILGPKKRPSDRLLHRHFCKQCGVPSTLARYVVVKGERSPNTIVDACLNGDFEQPKVPTRARGFGDRHGIRKDRTNAARVLGGPNFARTGKSGRWFSVRPNRSLCPNGFGKTSVFDAVDFAFTGDIGRLNIKADDRFKRVANHLDGK